MNEWVLMMMMMMMMMMMWCLWLLNFDGLVVRRDKKERKERVSYICSAGLESKAVTRTVRKTSTYGSCERFDREDGSSACRSFGFRCGF